MTSSRRLSTLLGLVGGAAFFGILAPYVMVSWVFAFALSLGVGPSPVWGFAAIVALLALVGMLAWRYRSGAFFRSLFFGGLVGVVAAVAFLKISSQKAQIARIERERTVFSSPSPLESLQISDAGGQPLWRIVALSDPRAIGEVRYGAVPQGYRQEVPPSGSPRLFRLGEPLKLDAKTISTIETRSGSASSPGGIRVLEYGGRSRLTGHLK